MDWADGDKELFRKARELSLRISQSLPRAVDPASISSRAKIPFKAVCVREVLIHRVSELGEVACDLIESGKIVAAIILVRALMESVALLYWLNKKLHAVVDAKATGDINDFLDRAMVGTRNAGTPLKAINVLNAIDEVTKEINEFRIMYYDLSEFAHPNWSGALGAYGTLHGDKILYELSSSEKIPLPMVLLPLAGCLEIFEHFYNDMVKVLPLFIKICEDELPTKPS